MNWYKKCLASTNIVIPDKTKSEVMAICSYIIKNWNDFEKSGKEEEKIASINIPDPYLKNNYDIGIFVSCLGEDNPDFLEITNLDWNNKKINVFPLNLAKVSKKYNLRKKSSAIEIYYYVIHEIIHVIDPNFNKGIVPRGQDIKNIPEYFQRYTEFNAFCKQTAENILVGCKNNMPEIIEWLKKDTLDPSPECVREHFRGPRQYWPQKPIFVRKFKQRMYNEIKNQIGKEKNV
jgi:hypothetical protein